MSESLLSGGSNFLAEPISIDELTKNGSSFKFAVDFSEDATLDSYFDELGIHSDNEDDENKPISHKEIVSPWTLPFIELKAEMEEINENLYKRIVRKGNAKAGKIAPNSRVVIRYSAYWEGESTPFDSTMLRGKPLKFYTSRHEVLEGIDMAVCTMRVGESAQFVISYKLLFGEIGCPPRIKKKADGLFIIDIVSAVEIGEIKDDDCLPEEERNKFAIVLPKARDLHIRGLESFKRQNIKYASELFKKATELLNYCSLSDGKEETEQREFLIKLYTNLAVCYNKIDMPKKTCITVKEIRRLTDNKISCKVLFQEARALYLLGEYDRSLNNLRRAQKLEPFNHEISEELRKVCKAKDRYKKSERDIWTKAMGLTKKPKVQTKEKSATIIRFEDGLSDILRDFAENCSVKTMKLPRLSDDELESVIELGKQFNISCRINPIDESYALFKKN